MPPQDAAKGAAAETARQAKQKSSDAYNSAAAAAEKAGAKKDEVAARAYAAAAAAAEQAGATKDEATSQAYDAASAAAEKAGAAKDDVVKAAQSATRQAKQYAKEYTASAQVSSLALTDFLVRRPYSRYIFLRYCVSMSVMHCGQKAASSSGC